MNDDGPDAPVSLTEALRDGWGWSEDLPHAPSEALSRRTCERCGEWLLEPARLCGFCEEEAANEPDGETDNGERR